MNRSLLRTLALTALLALPSFAADVRQGLVAYWPLDTLDLGNNLTPDMASTNNMTLVNETATVAGKYGQAVAFDGSSQYGYFVTDTNFDTGMPATRNPAYSVLLWVKGNGVGQSDRRYFCESDNNGNNDPLVALGSQQYGTNASTRIYIRNNAINPINYQNSTNATLDGNWHHVAMIYNQGAFRWYVDGKLDYTNRYTQGPSGFNTTSIGAIVRASVGSYLACTVDDVALWSRALSQGEIQDVMTNSIATPIPQFAPAFQGSPTGATNLIPGDAWTFAVPAYGTRPLTYQWLKNGSEIPGATTTSYALTNLASGDAAGYALVAANSLGRSTSDVATLSFATLPPPNITNSIIAYWPLDTVLGTKTPDLVSGYDMTLVKMGATNIVPGRWGNAFSFDNASQTLLQRVNNTGEDLPIYNNNNFSVSLWVNGLPQTDHRVFAEGSLTNGNPIFDLGTDNRATPDSTVDSFIRNDTGGGLDHRHSIGLGFDGNWHNLVYVQRDVGGGNMLAALYIDGVRDPVTLGPVRPLTVRTTTIGGLLRASASAWFTGMIDEVACWTRALSDQEIQILQVTTITNPPSRLQPLAINSFIADFPAVAKGGSTVLRWDVSKDVTQVTIDQGVGDVTAKTSVGLGTNTVTLTNTTTYVLTVHRGVDNLSATTTVAVVDGVAPGWALLDNFDLYPVGNLFGTGYWLDPNGNSAQVVDLGGNHVLRPATGNSIVFLNLQALTVRETQTCTLFFRLIPTVDQVVGITNIVGLTDKSQRSYADEFSNIGPVVYPTPFTNDVAGIMTNAWYVGARNYPAGGIDYPPMDPLQTNVVYNIWIDITNAPMGAPDYASDTFSVYLAKEGDATRTNLFSGYTSDRDLYLIDPVLGGMLPNLDKLVVIGNNANASALFDDFYLSVGGYNSTVPRAFGSTAIVRPGPVSVGFSGSQVEIRWTTGTLQDAPTALGPWNDVNGAVAPSYKVTPTGMRFYRARQ